MNNPIVSVYMLTYNHEKFIDQAIKSVLMQEVNFEYEIVIGDDSSSDSTPSILLKYKEKYPDIINLTLRDINLGATLNSWDIKRKCRGKYIAILEGDDFWNCKNKLQKQFDLLEENNQIIGVAHNIYRCDEDGESIKAYNYSTDVGTLKMEDVINKGLLYHTSTLMHRNIYKDSGDKYKKLLTSHVLVGDYPLALLLLSIGDILLIKERYSTHRVIINQFGTNAKSVAKRNMMRSVVGQLEQVFIIEEFFNDKYKFDNKKISLILALWYSFLPRVSEYTKTDIIKARIALKKIDFGLKLKALLSALIYIQRKIISLVKKIFI